MKVFEKVFRELNRTKVKYLVVGGVAVNLYGYLRFTGDLDVLLLLEEKNLKKMNYFRIVAVLCSPFLFARISGEPAKVFKNWASVLMEIILFNES